MIYYIVLFKYHPFVSESLLNDSDDIYNLFVTPLLDIVQIIEFIVAIFSIFVSFQGLILGKKGFNK